MKYYFNMFAIYSLLCIAACVGTIIYASFYDPQAEELIKLFVDCVVKILILGH